MASSPEPFVRRTRQVPHRDYHALNNGVDSLLPGSLAEDLYDKNNSTLETRDSISSDSPSPTEPSLQVLSSSPPLLSSATSTLPSGSSSPQLCRKRKDKSYSSWTLEYFWVTELDRTWSRNGGALKKDRLLVCKQCSWSSTDSARYGSTSNLVTHLHTRHRIKSGSSIASPSPVTSLDRFLGGSKVKLGLEQARRRASCISSNLRSGRGRYANQNCRYSSQSNQRQVLQRKKSP
jgi:hypothetical protein